MNEAAAFKLDVDPDFGADQSVALRYARGLCAADLGREHLLATSQREGVRLLELPGYRGVKFYLLDETTCMKTGTYKSLDGCVTTALCRSLGITRAVFSSGANTGIALTDYGARAGIETFFFCPESTLYKVDAALFERPTAHLIAVRGPDSSVKEAAKLFAESIGLPLIPQVEWRMLSASFRCLFIAEQMLSCGYSFSWFAQAVCAAYGPIGIYQALARLVASGQLERCRIPAFMGIQQAGLCPIASAWAKRHAVLPDAAPATWTEDAIEPTLYNARPDQTYPLLYDLLTTYGGDMMTVGTTDVREYGDRFTAMLGEVGIEQTTITVDGKDQLLESAGLLAGVGTLAAIDDGKIGRGQSVLCALTGGAAPRPTRRACPEFQIDADAPLPQQVAAYAEALGVTAHSPPRPESRKVLHHAD